jgi:REP element-mobilizing transposase RayT
MPRQARLDAPGTLHHVMIRGIERSLIFKDDQDRQDFTSRMGRLAKETRTRIVSCALMRHHVHLLFFRGPTGISKFMRRLLTGYALGYNRRHRRAIYFKTGINRLFVRRSHWGLPKVYRGGERHRGSGPS